MADYRAQPPPSLNIEGPLQRASELPADPEIDRLIYEWNGVVPSSPHAAAVSPPTQVSTTTHTAHNDTSHEDITGNVSVYPTVSPPLESPHFGHEPMIPHHGYPAEAPRSYPLGVLQPRAYYLARVPLRDIRAAPGFQLGYEKPHWMVQFNVKGGDFLWLGPDAEFERRCKNLVNGELKLQKQRGRQKASLRVCWPEPSGGAAYPDFKPQITVRRSTRRADLISCAKLAIVIRKQLGLFIWRNKDIPYGDPEWKVGPGGIELEDLCLIAVRVVSHGSIQPVLGVKRSM